MYIHVDKPAAAKRGIMAESVETRPPHELHVMAWENRLLVADIHDYYQLYK